MASQLLEKIQQRPGILGGCVLYRQRCMYTQLTPELTSYALALLQPTQSTSYTEEDNRRIQRRGLKIREMMLRGKNKLIRNREYRLRVYQNCTLGGGCCRWCVGGGMLGSFPTGLSARFPSRMLIRGVPIGCWAWLAPPPSDRRRAAFTHPCAVRCEC